MPRGRGKGRPAGAQSRLKVNCGSKTSRHVKEWVKPVDLEEEPTTASEDEDYVPVADRRSKISKAVKQKRTEEKVVKDDDAGRTIADDIKDQFDPLAIYPDDDNSCAQNPYDDLAEEGNNGSDTSLNLERLGVVYNPCTKTEPLEEGEISSQPLPVLEQEEQPPLNPVPAPSSFTTIDVSSLGLGSSDCTTSVIGNGNVGSEVEIDAVSVGEEFKVPKRRGRKPKAKTVANTSNSTRGVNNDQPSQFPFPQSFVNGMVSIDMSNLKISTAEQAAIDEAERVTLEGFGGITVAHQEDLDSEVTDTVDIKPLIVTEEIKAGETVNCVTKKGKKGFRKLNVDSEKVKKSKVLKRSLGKGNGPLESEPSVLSPSKNTSVDFGPGIVPISSKGKRGGKRTTVKTDRDVLPSASRITSNFHSALGSDTEDLFNIVEDEPLSLDMIIGFESSEVINVSLLASTDFRIEEIDGEQNYFRRLAPGVQESVAQRAREISLKVCGSKRTLNQTPLNEPTDNDDSQMQ